MTLRVLPLLALVVAPAPALAHHVGTYTPQDNELTTNFKQVKFSVQAGKFDVARRLFEAGALRAQMRAKAATLPPGLESGTRAALQAGDAPEVERRLMIFFAALARDRRLALPRGDLALLQPHRLRRRHARRQDLRGHAPRVRRG